MTEIKTTLKKKFKKIVLTGAFAIFLESSLEMAVSMPFQKYGEEYIPGCFALETKEYSIGEGEMRPFTTYITPKGEKGSAMGTAFYGQEITVYERYWTCRTPTFLKLLGASPTHKQPMGVPLVVYGGYHSPSEPSIKLSEETK